MDYENANKALDKARAKNRDVLQAETSQQLCCHKFEKISESAKQGLLVCLPACLSACACLSAFVLLCVTPCLCFSHTELVDFKTRRVAAFRKNLVELAELELKHAKVTTPPPAGHFYRMISKQPRPL